MLVSTEVLNARKQVNTLVRQRGARMLTAITPNDAQMMMANTAVTKISLPQAFHLAPRSASWISWRGAVARAACQHQKPEVPLKAFKHWMRAVD